MFAPFLPFYYSCYGMRACCSYFYLALAAFVVSCINLGSSPPSFHILLRCKMYLGFLVTNHIDTYALIMRDSFKLAIFCIAALTSFLSTHSLPDGSQFSHGFLACVITVLFSSIVALMLTVDWWRGFPSAGLSATLKALIISSFVMTIVIIIGAAIYSALEGWTFDEAVNFCIVSFATIGM